MRHVVLVGLPAAGKSTVGAAAAELLRAECVDIDAQITRRLGMPVAMIIGSQGESRFRDLEREAMAAALAEPPAVIVPGGGWAAQPGALEAARQRAFIIYVSVPVVDAAERAGAGEDRPLLKGHSPVQRMRALLEEREQFYRQADAEVRNPNGAQTEAATEIARLARSHAGW
jgi:shikimate kinase